MREILGFCPIRTCDGRLLPRGPLPGWPMSSSDRWTLDLHQPLDAAAQVGRREEPTSTSTLIACLFCSHCSGLFVALDEGRTREELRWQKYRGKLDVIAMPLKHCPACRAEEKQLALECVQGPYGIPPDRLVRRRQPLWDPIQDPIGVYCTVCNSVLGTLPPDPEAVAEYEAQSAELAKHMAAARNG